MIGEYQRRWRSILVTGLILLSNLVFSQNQAVSDSLISILDQIPDSLRFEVLSDIANLSSSPDQAIQYSEVLLAEARQKSNKIAERDALHSLGVAYRLKGKLDQALSYLFQSAKLDSESNNLSSLANDYSEIASTYILNNDLDNGLKYNSKAIDILRITKSNTLRIVLLNTGYLYYNSEKYDTALLYYNDAEPLFKKANSTIGVAYVIGNRALVKWKTGNYNEAIKDLNSAIEMLKPLGDEYGMADYYNQLGNIYYELDDLENAALNLSIGVRMAQAIDLKEQVRDASRMLSDIYRDRNQQDSAYHYLYQYLSMRDSIGNEEIARELANQRADFEIGLKQAEVEVLETKQRNQQIIIWSVAGFAVILMALAIIIYRFYQSKARTNAILEEQRQLLQSQKDQLEELNHTKDKFFSIISHDLRGPISAFMGVSRMIKHFVKSKNADQLIEVADEMEQSVARLSSLLDNLLNWALQQQGHFPHVPEKINLKNLITGVLSMFANMAHAKSISLSSQTGENIEVWGDPNMIQTIIRNLVNNALKFTPEEGSIAVDVTTDDGFAKIAISDTGVGIPKEKLEKLFNLHAKKSTYGTEGEKGLGLGLQLVNEFIELNNGQIEVESEEDEGTTFTISLPLYELHASEIQH